MHTVLLAFATLSASAAPLVAQEAPAQGGGGLLSPNPGLMIWTVVIFLLLLFILSWKVYPLILGAVEARERALEEAIEAAKRDRAEAAALLEQHRKQLEAARDEAQQVIAQGRKAGEEVRAELLEQAQREQQQLLERAQREIQNERDRAIAALRREAVDLAVRGASKVIEKNLDDQSNRALVEQFLASLPTDGAAR